MGNRNAAPSEYGNVPGNQTADTPEASERGLADMKVAELRAVAHQRGIAGADDLHKPELLEAAKKSLQEARCGGDRSQQDEPSSGRIRTGPDYGGQDLRQVSWDEWFDAFDERRLNFLYQEHRKDGNLRNFFLLENPEREDA